MARLAQQHIFVVEDDDAIRLWVGRELRAYGFDVECFASADAFLSAMSKLRPGCVLSDLRMPGGGGLKLLSVLKSHRSRFPVIVMTAYADVAVAVEAMKLGAVDLIEKPFDIGVMVDLLHSVQRRLAAGEHLNAPWEFSEIARERVAHLTARELAVLEGVMSGKLNKVIADELGLSPRTVEVYRARLMKKMQVRSAAKLVALALAALPADTEA